MTTATGIDSRGGLYIWKPKAGTVERWKLPRDRIGGYTISDDGRWITGMMPDGQVSEFHIVDRLTGKSWAWPEDPFILLEAEGTKVVVRDRNLRQPGTTYTFDETMRVVSSQPSPPPQQSGPAAEPRRFVSPDRSLIAQEITLTGNPEDGEDHLRWSGVVISDAPSGTPLFRIRAGLTTGLFVAGSRWLADSSGIVVSIGAVPEPGGQFPRFSTVLVSRDGRRLTALPTLDSGAPVEIDPSPADPDVFAIDRQTYVNVRTGETHSLQTGWTTAKFGAPWSLDGTELRFSILDGGHGSGSPILIPSILVDLPPFPAVLRFRVARAGTCLNIRDGASTEAAVLACVPDRTLLTLAPDPVREGSVPVSADTGPAGSFWVRVRTTDGTQGWASSDYLDWAE